MATALSRNHLGAAGVGFAVVAIVGLALVPVLAGGSEVSPTIQVPDTTVAADETTTVDLVLTTAPNGLAGYQLTVAVVDGDVARIEAVDYPSHMGLKATPEQREGGTAVRVRAVDIHKEVEPATTDVGLVTLRLRGLEAGETKLTVDVYQMDDDVGNVIEPAIDAGRVDVTTLDPAGAAGSSSDDGAEPSNLYIGIVDVRSPGELPLVAIIGVLALVTALLVVAARRRLPPFSGVEREPADTSEFIWGKDR